MLPKPLQRSLADLGEFSTTEDLEVFLETLASRVFTVFKKILGDPRGREVPRSEPGDIPGAEGKPERGRGKRE